MAMAYGLSANAQLRCLSNMPTIAEQGKRAINTSLSETLPFLRYYKRIEDPSFFPRECKSCVQVSAKGPRCQVDKLTASTPMRCDLRFNRSICCAFCTCSRSQTHSRQTLIEARTVVFFNSALSLSSSSCVVTLPLSEAISRSASSMRLKWVERTLVLDFNSSTLTIRRFDAAC